MKGVVEQENSCKTSTGVHSTMHHKIYVHVRVGTCIKMYACRVELEDNVHGYFLCYLRNG